MQDYEQNACPSLLSMAMMTTVTKGNLGKK